MIALIGGMLIGISTAILLIFCGRVTGISGIIYATIYPSKKDWAWRILFLSGLLLGGILFQLVAPERMISQLLSSYSYKFLSLAGLFVGFGTILGSGCTSGHGVCGFSRLSPRSILATLIFMSTAIATVAIKKYFLIFL